MRKGGLCTFRTAGCSPPFLMRSCPLPPSMQKLDTHPNMSNRHRRLRTTATTERRPSAKNPRKSASSAKSAVYSRSPGTANIGGEVDGLCIAGVGVAGDAHARVAGEHALQPRRAAGVPSATITWPAWML
jgi:hypothetical protein